MNISVTSFVALFVCFILGLASSMINGLSDHPFKMSAFFRGEGVKNLPNLLTDSTKTLPQ